MSPQPIQFATVPLKDVKPHPLNPRYFSTAEDDAPTEDVLVSGHHRHAVAQKLGVPVKMERVDEPPSE